MKDRTDHGFARALFAAAVLHCAAVSFALCVTLRASTVAGAVSCSVELAVEEPNPVDAPTPAAEQALPHRPPQSWTPSPLAQADMPRAEEPVADPVQPRWPSHKVPQLIVDIAAPPAVVPAEPVPSVAPGPAAGASLAGELAAASVAASTPTNMPAVQRPVYGAAGGIVAVGAIKPSYPASARRRGEEGVVVVTVETDDGGVPERVAVATPSGFAALDRAAVEAAKRAKFVASNGGSPRGRTLLSFRFRLVD